PAWRDAEVETAAGALSLEPGWQGALMVRPELVRFLGADETADFRVRGTLGAQYALGSRIQYSVETAGGMQLTVERPFESRHETEAGSPVVLGWDRGAVHPIAGALEAQ